MKIPALLALLVASLPSLLSGAEGFQWEDNAGQHCDLSFNGKRVARYVYQKIDLSSPEQRELTYKPFHHVYDSAGRDFITKGPGGKFPHHRGIYYGFSKTSYRDSSGTLQTVDTWHCRPGKDGQPGAHQTHEAFIRQTASAQEAVQSVRIDWHGNDGAVFASEERTLTFSMGADSALTVDFRSALTPVSGTVKVDGDPQHAGFHFRASGEVADVTAKQTYYIRPGTGQDAPGKAINWDAKNDSASTRDLPWKAMSFLTGGKRYTVVYLDRPQNPKPARFSERDYGRFGSYFVAEATAEKPLEVAYRLVISEGERTAEACEALSRSFWRP